MMSFTRKPVKNRFRLRITRMDHAYFHSMEYDTRTLPLIGITNILDCFVESVPNKMVSMEQWNPAVHTMQLDSSRSTAIFIPHKQENLP